MDETQRFMQAENIRRFSEQLFVEQSPEKRAALLQLLTEEENKFPVTAWHFGLAQTRLMDCQKRVDAQRALIAEMESRGADLTAAKRVLANMEQALGLFRDFRDKVVRALRDNPS